MPKKKTRIIQVPMPVDLVEKLDAISYEVEESRAHVIRDAVAQYVTAREEAEADRRYAEAYAKYPEDMEEVEALARAAASALEPENWPEYAEYDK
jgi:metal-responsive CopG/Arc/MetJ family transcriptional regulator